jgi:hypothetical protein
MTVRRFSVAGAVCAFVLAVGMQVAAAAIGTAVPVGDASFEVPKLAPNSFATFPTGSTLGTCGLAMPGSPGYQFGCWRVFAGNVDVTGDGYWQAAAGHQTIELNGTTNGSILQAFRVSPSNLYRLSFRLAGDPFFAGQVKLLVVQEQFDANGSYMTGGPLGTYTFDTTGRSTTSMGFVKESVTFGLQSNAAYADIEFQSLTTNQNAPWWGPVVDQVGLRSIAV